MPLEKINIVKNDSLDNISELRFLYLDYLIEPQEMYLELLIRQSNVYTIIYGKAPIGYFLINSEGLLLEFFITEKFQNLSESVLGRIIKEYSIKSALCKSFDSILLSSALTFQKVFQQLVLIAVNVIL